MPFELWLEADQISCVGICDPDLVGVRLLSEVEERGANAPEAATKTRGVNIDLEDVFILKLEVQQALPTRIVRSNNDSLRWRLRQIAPGDRRRLRGDRMRNDRRSVSRTETGHPNRFSVSAGQERAGGCRQGSQSA